jgi:hypothetical protein
VYEFSTAFEVTFPAGTSLVGSENSSNNDCTLDTVMIQSTVSGEFFNPAAEACSFTFSLKMNRPGTYTRSDHRVRFGPHASDLNLNITVLGTDEPVVAETAVPAVCDRTPDMAVSPELFNLAPGGTATVDVTLRNLCKDARFNDSDLRVSLSDGLTVVDGSDGLVNLGQRAAWQEISLAPDETRTWSVTVSAAAVLTAALQHVTELYYRGRVASRIDGVFITPSPAPVVEAAPAAAAAPAPIPAALPNTAGETAGNAWLPPAALLTALVSVSLLLVRRRS